MEIVFLTLNPEFFGGFLKEGILAKAISKGIIKVTFINFREFTLDKHSCVDDTPYGGGSGMLLKPEPIIRAFESVELLPRRITIMPAPDGKIFSSEVSVKFSYFDQMIFICGRYEGIDSRVSDIINPEHISVGNYILSNGELAALVIFNAVMRNIPGVLGNSDSLKEESFSINRDPANAFGNLSKKNIRYTDEKSGIYDSENENLLEYPQYTRPYSYRGFKVPDVLREGNHKLISEWMINESVKKTKKHNVLAY
ncbi:tRNA (guanine(37)-N(1))-methyltransferase [Candidatus Dependentiae bacterium]|nr:tRNA (guanine(37)-N(1))-methyltransferase [Candidatus Dependentiae bacterium]